MQKLRMRKAYDLVIDAWSEHEYAVDQISGAMNLLVMNNDEYAGVGRFAARAKWGGG